MSEFTPREVEALKEFREKLEDLNLNEERREDAYLIRWLRARDLNVAKAEEMLRKSLKWREENDMDSILEWKAPEIYHKISPIEICGQDKAGRPVMIAPSRYFDLERFWELDLDEYIRYSAQNVERLLYAMKQNSTPENPVRQFIGIYDVAGFNFRAILNRRGKKLVHDSTKVIEENYPELVFKVYIVYAPRVFSLIFAMMKHVVPKRTIQKVHVLCSNKDKWAHLIQEHISPEFIPPRYGGTNEEFEMTAFANCGLKPGDRKVSLTGEIEVDGYIESQVPAGKKLEFEYDITSSNSMIEWCFKTENYDIGFSVTFGKDGEELVPYQRLEAQSKKQKGSIICEKPGRYTLIFDNTFSRMRSKTLHLKVDIEDSFCEASEDGLEIIPESTSTDNFENALS